MTMLAEARSTARYARWDGVGRGFSTVAVALPDTLDAGEILVRVDLATICGSDVHSTTGHRPAPAPGVLGHEQVGTVLALGPDVAPAVDGVALEPGQRVVWSVAASCGRCPRCRRGLPQKCLALFKYGHEPLDPEAPLSGGFATHCVLRAGTAVVVVPPDVPDRVAGPAGCATATVAAALAAAPSDLAGARVLVTGAGMLGLTAAAMAHEAGAVVVVSDPHPARRDRALAFGAHEVAAPEQTVRDVDVALELSGAPAAVGACLDSLAVGGTAVLVGSVSPGRPVELDPQRLVRGWQTVTGVHNYRPRDLLAAVRFLARRHDRHPFAELVAGDHGLDDLAAAFAAAAGDAPRQAVDPQR